jgi:hypothetical protein
MIQPALGEPAQEMVHAYIQPNEHPREVEKSAAQATHYANNQVTHKTYTDKYYTVQYQHPKLLSFKTWIYCKYIFMMTHR